MAQATCPASSLRNKSLHALEKAVPFPHLVALKPDEPGQGDFPGEKPHSKGAHSSGAPVIKVGRQNGGNVCFWINSIFWCG